VVMTTTPQPLVSIVTPVYNEAEYLSQCIESVLGQTHENWQYTIVDNCSSDGSRDIAHRYAARDSRIRVHENQQFHAVLANHNAALRQISPASKYCKMVFADDWIFPECLARMIAVAEEHPSVGLVSAYCLQGQEVTCTGLPYSTRVLSGREICRQHLLNELYVWASANTVLYRADLVRSRDPFFNEANTHADTEACFELLKGCDFGFVHQVLTFTRVRSQSLTTVSTDLQTNLGGRLRILLAHGPAYLTGPELDLCVDRHLSEYYRYLGKNVFLGRDREFWSYHRQAFAETGLGFSRARLVRAALANLRDAVLCPRDTIEKLMSKRNRASRARGRSADP
jgi:glycosyltransferase involved in cell wall biosynthesis